MKRKRAVIIGAGPVGLISAWKLLEQGWLVEIYEKESLVGGMCRTWKWNDFLIDTGPHIYHTPDSKLAEFWEKEFGDLLLKGEFWCKNVKGDKFDEYWDYPLSWESISRYPRQLKETIFGQLENLNSEQKARATNYTQYIEAQVGPSLREMFFAKYPEKIWGISTDQMTPDWAPKRIEFRQKVTPFYHNQWNAVGKYGTGSIYQRIRDKVLELNGKIYLNSEVKGVLTKGNSISGIKVKGKGVIEIEEEDILISTMPISLLSDFLGYKSDLQFRGIRTVYLVYDKKTILPEGIHWLYYDSEKVYFNRVTEAKKLTPYIAPDDKTYLACEITFSPSDKIDSLDSQTLIDQVAQQVELVGLAKKCELVDGLTNSEYFVYPVQYTGYKQELAKAKSVISKYQQLYSLGTGGDFYYADSQILFHKSFDLVNILCGKESAHTQVVRQTPRCSLNPQVNISNRGIGGSNKAYIIAEAGLNHNGSLMVAKQLIDQAQIAGCDVIKFQTFTPADRISKKIKAAKYSETIIGLEETPFEMFQRLTMSFDDQKELFDYAGSKGIDFFSTPFDIVSADFLNSLGVNLFKISSMDLVNIPLLEHVASFGKPIILSTGMSTLGQIEEAVNTIVNQGNPNLMLLHCLSSYPAVVEEMNLKVIETLKQCFGIPVGLSDHSFGLFASQIALAIGADIIERHFTLDRMLEGPDHILSSEPWEMKKLVDISKKIKVVLGDGVKRISHSEYDALNMHRKSLYARANIKKGDLITEEVIMIKGPAGGLLPKYRDIVIGRIAKEDIEEDYPITWENV